MCLFRKAPVQQFVKKAFRLVATVVTYVLLPDAGDDPDILQHPLLDERGFEQTEEEEGEAPSILQLKAEWPLEDHEETRKPYRTLSASVPDATLIVWTVVERFQQIEHLRTDVYRGGTRVSGFERGFVYNVGRG